MPKILANGLRFHYWQTGEGPDVVLIHGLGGNLAGWHLGIVPELQNEYRVTTYDLRGHGRSDAPATGYGTHDMARDLLGLMDAFGIERAHVVGHSWGADIALQAALAHPNRVLDLAVIEGALLAPLARVYRSPSWEGWPYVTGTIESLSNSPIPEDKRFDLEYLLQQLIEIPILYGPSRGRPRDGGQVARAGEVLRPLWRGNEDERELSVDSLASIRHRTLLIYEANSVFMRAYEVLRDLLPNRTAVLLPGTRLKHFSGLEHPDLISSRLRAFFGRERARAASVPKEEAEGKEPWTPAPS